MDDNADQDSDFEIAETEEAIPSDDEMWSGDEDENSKAVREAQGMCMMTTLDKSR